MKKLLVVVDMVNGFIKTGAMADSYINRITPEVRRLMEEFIMDENGEVVAFCDSHTLESEEFKNYPVHCLKGTEESELIDEIKDLENQILVFEKDTINGFIEKEYYEYFEQHQEEYEEIIVVGCCSDICVLNYALSQKADIDQKGLNISVIVPKNAIETFEGEGHNREEFNQKAIVEMVKRGIYVVDRYDLEKIKKGNIFFKKCF